MAGELLREVALADAVGVEPHRTVWVVYRQRGPMVTGMVVSPHGERISRVKVDHTIDALRGRLLHPRAREALRRSFTGATIVFVSPDEDIPEPLRRAFRSVWGRHYGG